MRHAILFVALGGLATCSLGFAQDIGSGGPASTPSDALSPREERRLERREALIHDTAPTPNLDRQEAAQDRVDENVPGAANVDSEVGRGTSFNAPGAQVTLPPAGSGGRVGINVPGAGVNLNVPNPNQWRMQWHRNNWWYWHPNNTWSYWDNNRWNSYGAPNGNQQDNSFQNNQNNMGQNNAAQNNAMPRGNSNNIGPRYGTGYRGLLRNRRNYSTSPNGGGASMNQQGGVNAPLYGSGTLSQPDSTRTGQPLNGSQNPNAQGANPVNQGNNNPSNATGNNLGNRLNTTTSGQLNGSAGPAPGSNSTGSGVGATGGGGSQSQSGIITSGPGAGGTTSGAVAGGGVGAGGSGAAGSGGVGASGSGGGGSGSGGGAGSGGGGGSGGGAGGGGGAGS